MFWRSNKLACRTAGRQENRVYGRTAVDGHNARQFHPCAGSFLEQLGYGEKGHHPRGMR